MSVAANKSESLSASEVFLLPPYAENILVELASTESGATLNSCSSVGGTYHLCSGFTAIVANRLFKVDQTVLQYVKCNKACTIHYRVSKR